jgi:hypothetical protein
MLLDWLKTQQLQAFVARSENTLEMASRFLLSRSRASHAAQRLGNVRSGYLTVIGGEPNPRQFAKGSDRQ